jgi:hypothetical protein
MTGGGIAARDTRTPDLLALCKRLRELKCSSLEIATEVFLSVDAVKTHLRALFRRLEIGDLPQNQKRARLVECAFQWGLVARRDL